MYAVNKNRMRRPLNPRELSGFGPALAFMEEAVWNCYANEISELQADFEELQADAGPGGPDCPVTQEILDGINEEIEALAQSAYDRVQDWSDGLREVL